MYNCLKISRACKIDTNVETHYYLSRSKLNNLNTNPSPFHPVMDALFSISDSLLLKWWYIQVILWPSKFIIWRKRIGTKCVLPRFPFLFFKDEVTKVKNRKISNSWEEFQTWYLDSLLMFYPIALLCHPSPSATESALKYLQSRPEMSQGCSSCLRV